MSKVSGFMGTEEEETEIRADLDQEVATTFLERAQQRAADQQSVTAGRYGGNQQVCQCSQASVRSCSRGNQSCGGDNRGNQSCGGGNHGNQSCGGGNRGYQRQCCCSKLLRFIPSCSCTNPNQGNKTNQSNNQDTQDNAQKPIVARQAQTRQIKRSISAPQQPSRSNQRTRHRTLEPRHYSISPAPTAPVKLTTVERPRISSPTFHIPSLPALANSASTLPRKALFRTRGEWNMYERPLITTIPSSSYRINSSLSELCSSIKVVRKAVPCSQCTTNNQQYTQYMQSMPVMPVMPQGPKAIELNLQAMFDKIPDIPDEESPPVQIKETHSKINVTTGPTVVKQTSMWSKVTI